MKLQITKNNNKPHIILYQRDNGSETWMHSADYFVVHDLSHFAIEKTLCYSTAFMGMLNNGMDVTDFEDREKRKMITVTDEAVYAENMANLFLMEVSQGKLEDFNKTLQQSFTPMSEKVIAPVLSDNQIESIRNYLKELISRWNALPAGQTMDLIYDIKN